MLQRLLHRWAINFLDNMNFKTLEKLRTWAFSRVFCRFEEVHKISYFGIRFEGDFGKVSGLIKYSV